MHTTNSSEQPIRTARLWARRMGLIVVLPLVTSCTVPSPASDVELVRALFTALRTGSYSNIQTLVERSHLPPQDSATWPMLMYIRGEAYQELGETERARKAFRDLVSWAVADHPSGPYGDTWGGSGLSAVALWRWLEIVYEHGPSDSRELDLLLEVAPKLQETRLYSAMVRSRLLPALPLLEERVQYLLAQIAWTNERVDEAKLLYVNFLAVNSDGSAYVPDNEIRKEILSEGLATADRLDLYAALRQLSFSWPQQKKDAAAGILKRLYDNQDVVRDIRAIAGYEWANYMRFRNQQEAAVVLSVVATLAQDDADIGRALFRRATVHRRADDRNRFREDMETILDRFPDGSLADDALAQLAADDLYERHLDTALGRYEDLRRRVSTSDLEDVAHFYPALGLFARGGDGDLEAANQLLAEYLLRNVDSIHRWRYLFWQGRIAERLDNRGTAVAVFRQIVDEVPYDYYGLRARMHLEQGEAASVDSIPAPESQIYGELQAAYANSYGRVSTDIAAPTPYHRRVREAIETGLYGRLLEIDQDLRGRIDDLSLVDLDRSGMVPFAALLVSLRQDALAAKDHSVDADNWLKVMALVSSRTFQDWPVVIEMMFLRNDAERKRWLRLQKEAPYLATVYPDVERIPVLAESLEAASWDIDGAPGLSQAIMYAVIRHESGFYPRAISAQGALGLFQFMPQTFRALTGERGVMPNTEGQSEVDYLLDPRRNIALWARWVDAEFPIERRRNILSSIMRHQAGSGNVAEWREYWESARALDDIEFQIETVRFLSTRGFLRRVLRDTIIADAAGIFVDRTRFGRSVGRHVP